MNAHFDDLPEWEQIARRMIGEIPEELRLRLERIQGLIAENGRDGSLRSSQVIAMAELGW